MNPCKHIFCLLFTDVSKSMTARQKLEAQFTENNIVKEVRIQTAAFHIKGCILGRVILVIRAVDGHLNLKDP